MIVDRGPAHVAKKTKPWRTGLEASQDAPSMSDPIPPPVKPPTMSNTPMI